MTNVEDRVERALHVLAEHIEPNVAAARARVAALDAFTPHRVARERIWVTLAAASVALIGLGSLIVVSRSRQEPVAQTEQTGQAPPAVVSTDPPDDSADDTTSAPPSSSSAPEPSTTVVDFQPDIPTPELLAILDPQPGVAPIRSNPILDWVHSATAPVERRWFVSRSTDGTPTGGLSVAESTSAQWVTTFQGAPSAGIAGVDARAVVTVTGAQVAWLMDDGTRVVAGLGDVDLGETIAAAALAVSATNLEDVTIPEGFEEVAVPVEQGTVRYDDSMVTIAFSTVRGGGPVDVAVAALMTPGREGPIARIGEQDAWLTTTFGGHPTAVIAAGTDGVATIVGMPDTQIESLASTISVVPASEVSIADPEQTLGIPPDATMTYGEIDRGRWAVYEFTTTHGTCFAIDASWGGSGDCTPTGHDVCPVADIYSGPSTSPGFEVFLPYVVDELTVSLDGEPAEATVEQAQGYTFAYGLAPSTTATIEVTVDGHPAC